MCTAAKKRSGVRGAVWSLTGIIKIRADDEGKGREAQCEKVKLTQTLSITFHLTRVDDNVDTADDAETRQRGTTGGLAVSTGVKHHKVGVGRCVYVRVRSGVVWGGGLPVLAET